MPRGAALPIKRASTQSKWGSAVPRAVVSDPQIPATHFSPSPEVLVGTSVCRSLHILKCADMCYPCFWPLCLVIKTGESQPCCETNKNKYQAQLGSGLLSTSKKSKRCKSHLWTRDETLKISLWNLSFHMGTWL